MRGDQLAMTVLVLALGGCSEAVGPENAAELSCNPETTAVSLEYSNGARSGTFCADGAFPYWQHDPGEADTVPWAHALKRGDEGWILLVAHAPAARGEVNRFVLLLPSRRFGIRNADGSWQPGLWRGPYNLGCASSTDPAADDCWGLAEIGYCLADADPDRQAQLPDCLAGWPSGYTYVHMVGFVAAEGHSDHEYQFEAGEVLLDREVTGPGQILSGTVSGTLRPIAGTSSSTRITVSGRFRVVVRNAPFWF